MFGVLLYGAPSCVLVMGVWVWVRGGAGAFDGGGKSFALALVRDPPAGTAPSLLFAGFPVHVSNRSSSDSDSNSSDIKGVVKEILTPAPAGAQKPKKGQTVTVHCTGYGKNRDLSQKFWSTKDPGQVPFSYSIGLGQVIKGWDEGVMDMAVGEVARLTCSPEYGYGAGGFESWGIMPNSILCFEIEVLSIE